MNATPEPVERYLTRLKKALQGTTPEEQAEILSDIRSLIQEHLDTAERSHSTVEIVLKRLGPPEALADAYRVEGLLSRAAHSSAPVLLATAVLRWAMSGLYGFITALVAFAGYGLVFIFLISAVLKIAMPLDTGVWVGPDFFEVGSITPTPPGVREVLGYWMVPLCLLLTLSSYVLTNYVVRWLIRHRDHTTLLKPR